MLSLNNLADTFRGRAILMGAAVAVTIVVFVASAVISVRANVADEHATDRLIESVEVAAELRSTYARVTDTMAAAATERDASLIQDAFEMNVTFTRLFDQLDRLTSTDPALREQYDSLLAVRDASYAYAAPYAELIQTGRFDEAVTLTESPDFQQAVGGFFPALESVLQRMLTDAEVTRAESSRRQAGAMALAGLGFLMVVLLWGAMAMDWAAQTRAARRAHARLADMNDELERRVTARTVELNEARVRAEEANRAKSEFLAAMSHELRTPLNGVLGMATVLQRSSMTESQKGMLQVIESSGRSLLTLLNDVLDYARLEAGQMTLRAEPFELGPVLERVMAGHAESARDKGLDMSLTVASEAQAVFVGDEVRIAQVVTNLLSNAVKFTHEGGVTVTAEPAGERVRITVKDTGVGVQPAHRTAIFERFSQADYSARRRYGGAGLGLALARELVAAMGGDIGVESTPGEGSEFWFEIPLERWTPSERALPSGRAA